MCSLNDCFPKNNYVDCVLNFESNFMRLCSVLKENNIKIKKAEINTLKMNFQKLNQDPLTINYINKHFDDDFKSNEDYIKYRNEYNHEISNFLQILKKEETKINDFLLKRKREYLEAELDVLENSISKILQNHEGILIHFKINNLNELNPSETLNFLQEYINILMIENKPIEDIYLLINYLDNFWMIKEELKNDLFLYKVF
mmetsp:Transcript_21050/g.53309  ORF Transcript_21050/g.53309 Transcript_21050/m.53309 type:complete len:201 (-) Transcript_21050:2-604(-)